MLLLSKLKYTNVEMTETPWRRQRRRAKRRTAPRGEAEGERTKCEALSENEAEGEY